MDVPTGWRRFPESTNVAATFSDTTRFRSRYRIAPDLLCGPSSHTAPSQGFTLIEVLVVVVIIGVIALSVALTVGASSDRRLNREAERLQALITYACNRAELTGRELGVVIAPDGFAFTRLGLDGWKPLPDEGELRTRHWPDTLRITLRREGRVVDLSVDTEATPQLVCFSSGEMTPFTIELTLGDSASYRLDGDEDGVITLRREEAQR